MSDSGSPQKLKMLSPSEIEPNPENPRLVFRQEEMESLMLSIDKHGIQVPLTVYQEGAIYRLLDGERRWRCAKKLNLKTVPAIVQAKPTELDNLVLMYNIHALREQWDYYTIATSLQRIIVLYEAENDYYPNEIVLSELTGLTRGAIRRCQLLLDLPDRFKSLLREELQKPKSQQKLSEDFFIEMERSLKTVTRRLTEYAPRIDQIRDVLVAKYQSKTIAAVTDFRKLSKIATAVESLGIAHKSAKKALDKVFDPKQTKEGIAEAYKVTVEFGYIERRALKHVDSVSEFLEQASEDHDADEIDSELLESMEKLYVRLRAFLGKAN